MEGEIFSVYVLYSPTYDKIYIGFTSDLENRLLSHNHLAKNGWTIKFRPWKLAYVEEFNDKKAAMEREKQLKSAIGRDFVRAVIARQLHSNL